MGMIKEGLGEFWRSCVWSSLTYTLYFVFNMIY